MGEISSDDAKAEVNTLDRDNVKNDADSKLLQDESNNAPKEEKKSFDDLLSVLGEFGRYQRFVYFFLFLPTVFSAMHKLAWVFLGAEADHRCLLPGEDKDTAEYDDSNSNSMVSAAEECSYLDHNGSEHFCDRGYVYDRSTFGSSAVMDWDLVCADNAWRATAQALFMLGVLVGSYVFGDLSDRMGRKPVFVASVVIQVSFISAFHLNNIFILSLFSTSDRIRLTVWFGSGVLVIRGDADGGGDDHLGRVSSFVRPGNGNGD